MKRSNTKRKIVGIFLSAAMVAPLAFSQVSTVSAENFSGKESQYYRLCSASNLTASKRKTCKEFNTYLKNKSASLKKSVTDAQKSVSDNEASLTEIVNKIDTLKKQISANEKQIAYVSTSITNTQNELNTKKEQLKEKMYSMQTSMNSNVYVDYLFNADSLTDLFSRAATINDVTEYENDLIDEINEKEKELQTQKKTLSDTQTKLSADKSSAEKEQTVLYSKITGAKQTLASTQAALKTNTDNMELIARNMANEERLAATKVTKKVAQIQVSNTSASTATTTSSGNVSLGQRIANAALSKQGCMYKWGASGPNRFDCSGLVSWACNAAGLSVGRQTSGSFAGMGRAVSRSNIQAGDIITFGSPVHHVGIAISSTQYVHAPATGRPVQVASISSRHDIHNIRRLY